MSLAEFRRSDFDVGDHPLEVSRYQVSRCLIVECVVAGLPLSSFTRGRRIDLDLDPVERRARAAPVGGPNDERVITFPVTCMRPRTSAALARSLLGIHWVTSILCSCRSVPPPATGWRPAPAACRLAAATRRRRVRSWPVAAHRCPRVRARPPPLMPRCRMTRAETSREPIVARAMAPRPAARTRRRAREDRGSPSMSNLLSQPPQVHHFMSRGAIHWCHLTPRGISCRRVFLSTRRDSSLQGLGMTLSYRPHFNYPKFIIPYAAQRRQPLDVRTVNCGTAHARSAR